MPRRSVPLPVPSGLPAHIVSLHRSNGGVPKLSVPSARITVTGMEGDRQRNLKYHGGPDRALCLYSQELIDALEAEGEPVFPGSMGENIVLGGIDWRTMVPGTRLRLGSVDIELTSYAPPCRSIRGSFIDGRFGRVSPTSNAGWSRVCARVLSGGVIAVGDPVHLL